MSLVRALVLGLAAMVLLLATASAVDYNTKCKTMSASDKDGDFFTIMANDVSGAPTCYYFPDAGETADPKIIMEYTPKMQFSKLKYDVLVWNIDQVAGWTMAVVGAGSSFTSITGKIDATTAGDFGSYMELAPGSGLQTGATFQFNFTTTHAVGIMLAPRPLSDDSNPAVNRGAPYSYKVAAIDTTLELAVTEPFDTMQKAAKTVDVTLTAAEITATSNPATFKASRLQNTGVPAPPQLDPVVEAGSVKIPYRNFGVSRGITRGDSKISIALPVLDDDYVNWKETGPWRTGTVSITSTMYPTLTSTWQKFDISPGASIYAILGKGMWWQSAVVYHQFGGDSAPSGRGYVSTGDSSFGVTPLDATSKPGVYATMKNPVVNTDLVGTRSASDDVRTHEVLPGGTQVATTMSLRFMAAPSSIFKNPSTLWLRAEYKDLTGECFSNADCNPGKDDDTVAGHVLSANRDRARMRTCKVLPSSFDYNTFSTRCTECEALAGCGAGQYCHTDVGACNGADGNIFLCDPDSNALAGICREKDPSGSVFGKPCATATVRVWKSTGSFVERATVSEGANADTVTAGGLCGEARYYNASYVPDKVAFQYPAGVARTMLWQGRCDSGICLECQTKIDSPFMNSAKQHLQCVNGREVERRDVDFTIRTLTSNTIAGILLTAVIGIIIILIFLCFNAKQTMSKGDTYRKSLRQKYEDEQLVRAKSGMA